jgi:hypothetical protein
MTQPTDNSPAVASNGNGDGKITISWEELRTRAVE